MDEHLASKYLQSPTASVSAAVYSYNFFNSTMVKGGSIQDFTAAVITLYPGFYPSDYESHSWLSSARAILEDSELKNGAWMIWNSELVSADRRSQQWQQFKSQICITAAIVLVVISILLRSAFVPVRLCLTLFLPLFSCFGLATLVYQDGVLNFSGWASVVSSAANDSFQQDTVIILFSLCLALALDYDIFLLSRMRWHRFQGGLAHRDSIIRALSETGPTISRAGIIMALAFGGNLVGDVPLFCQLAWIVGTSVLIDTFVVRPVLVPAICSLCPSLMWWPMKVPS